MKITSQVAHNTSAKDSPEEGNLGVMTAEIAGI